MACVYVLTNPSIPGMVKIGQTDRTAYERAREISTGTGIPTAFTVAYYAETTDFKAARWLERRIHDALATHRVNRSREFFAMTVADAIVYIETIGHNSNAIAITSTEIAAKAERIRAEYAAREERIRAERAAAYAEQQRRNEEAAAKYRAEQQRLQAEQALINAANAKRVRAAAEESRQKDILRLQAETSIAPKFPDKTIPAWGAFLTGCLCIAPEKPLGYVLIFFLIPLVYVKLSNMHDKKMTLYQQWQYSCARLEKLIVESMQYRAEQNNAYAELQHQNETHRQKEIMLLQSETAIEPKALNAEWDAILIYLFLSAAFVGFIFHNAIGYIVTFFSICLVFMIFQLNRNRKKTHTQWQNACDRLNILKRDSEQYRQFAGK